MTSTISYNLHQLDGFRSAASSAAGQYGSIGDRIDLHASASIFGQNAGAAALSAAVADLDSTLRHEFARAETLLRDVSRSIDAVQSAIEEADRNGKRTFTTKSSGTSGGGGGGGTTSTAAVASANPNAGTAPAVKFGEGVKVDLPDGLGTVAAPNAKAAGAVREALTQLGVPYVWGGETPGPNGGFDCSGLTQWAYGHEGISLPHDAAAQNIGQRVPESNLAPGDLVVWDGHVAMYIGNGHMIEAPHTGDVVHIVPLRTDNAGDAFEGFFRPTA